VNQPGVADRVRQARRLARTEGAAGVVRRLRARAADKLSPAGRRPFPVCTEHLLRAAEMTSSGWTLPSPRPARPGEPLTVAWVCRPVGDGVSGGHTTMFRLVAGLEKAGHTCVIYLDDRHGWSLEQHRRTIRAAWPWVQAEVRDAADGIEDADAVFATAWETAYVVLASRARGVRFYLVQDYEPSFYAAGSDSLLAEATYRFGFQGVTAGRWLAQVLARDYGMAAEHFDFGRGTEYVLDGDAEARNGVCFFSRPDTPRRAFELGSAALELFAARHPEIDLHLFGEPAGPLSFAATDHGTLPPARLNRLFNRCIAGLVLSATNVSLAPHDMLAAGCIPVVNDAEHNRIVLDNDHVAYAPATPFHLADALSALVERPRGELAATAASAAASVDGRSWDDAGAAVERIVREVVDEATRPSSVLGSS